VTCALALVRVVGHLKHTTGAVAPDRTDTVRLRGALRCTFQLCIFLSYNTAVLTLLVLQGPDKGRRFELPDEPLLLGRESRQLPLSDNTVSRRHCELLPDGGVWILHDLGSANGTYLNGTRVEGKTSLRLGDQLRVGRTLMVFGSQPGVSRSSNKVSLTGQEAGMDASIMHTVASNEDSMVLAVPEPAAAAMSNLKILYQLGAALGSSFDSDQVLEVVMDLVFEHVKADRGIILIHDDQSNELIPRVVRTRDENAAPEKEKGAGFRAQGSAKTKTSNSRTSSSTKSADGDSSLRFADETREKRGSGSLFAEDKTGTGTVSPSSPNPEPRTLPTPASPIHASRTIINHVMQNGEGVLSSNAMTDQRFEKGKSVHSLGIRSALCVPIKARKLNATAGDEILGVIYIDSSVKNYTYSPDQLRLLTAIGLQAGMALQNAKLYRAGLQAERLAAIGETTAALSHSIKNILQALRGGADVVEMGIKGQNVPQAAKGWGVVNRNLDKIYNLTMNLLAYSRPREPQLELVHPKKIVDDCLELISSAANEKKVMAIADVDRNQPPIPADPDGIHQVLMNLISNALDAAPSPGGIIQVKCHYDADNRQTVLDVIDNGPGIPPSMMEHMFELFHSTKGNRGTGLGLAVSKKIVDEHDGTISVKSSAEGTTFTVRLPVVEGVTEDPSTTHGPRASRR
jgi:signal transduction histidine kinase/pSer/pThr/pTyr-binding forkhead associated (FHA) protein